MAAPDKKNRKEISPVKVEDFKLGFGEKVPELNVAMSIRHMSVMLRSGISLSNTVGAWGKMQDHEIMEQ